MSVRRSMVWSLLGNWVYFGSTLLAGIVLARLLTPTEFGVFTVAIATVGILQAILQLGTGSIIMRAAEVDDTFLGSALAVALLEGLAVALVVAGLSGIIADWQRSAEVGRILLLLAPVPFFTAIENVLVAIWWRNLQFGRSAALLSAKSVVQATVSIGLAVAGLGPASLAAGMLGAALLGLLVAAWGLWGRKVRPNFRHFRSFATFGGKWMILGGLRAVNARMPELLLGRLVGLAGAGLYNRASASLDMVVRNGVEPIARVMLPVFAQANRHGAGMAEGVIKLSSSITAIFWPILGFLALESSDVIVVLFGDNWIAAAPVLALLCLWSAMMLPTSGTGEVLLILDRLGLSLRIETSRTIVGIAFVVVAAPAGLLAVAAVRVLEPLLFLPVYVLVLRRLAGMSVRRWARAHAQSLLVTLLTLAPVLLVRSVFPSPDAVVLNLAVKGALAAVSFLGALFLLGHPLAAEGLQIVRRRLGWGA